MNAQEIVKRFLTEFPEHRNNFDEHMNDYGELLQHVFYSEAINYPLIELLKADKDSLSIQQYCGFIEYMWLNGDASVKNVVDVTILEQLSDDKKIWRQFGRYISVEFKDYINNELLLKNLLMGHVKKL